MKLKFTQIIGIESVLYGLDKDGQVWWWDGNYWKRRMEVDPNDNENKEISKLSKLWDEDRGFGNPF